MALRARDGKLLRVTNAHKLAKTCGPPGCTSPDSYPVCGPKTPDSLTVTLAGISFCNNTCHAFTDISGPVSDGRFTGPTTDLNGSYCVRATGGNTWQADFTGNYAQLYGTYGSGVTDCSGSSFTLDTMRISVQRFINSPGISTASRFYVRALVGYMSLGSFVPVLAAFYYYDGETSDLLLDCRASVTVSNQNAGCGEFEPGQRENYPALGNGGTVTVVGCCNCPSNGTGCCDTIGVIVSTTDFGEYTFLRTGNHWNGQYNSIIHCVRGQWEMIVYNSDGTKSATFTAGDGITSMECPPVGDPADWSDPVLTGGATGEMTSIACTGAACASNCDFCCDVIRFDYLDPDGNPAYVEFTKDNAAGETCSWELTDSSALVTDANLTCTDGVWTLFTLHDGVTEQSFSADATAEGCPSDNVADWTTLAGGQDLTLITLSGCA